MKQKFKPNPTLASLISEIYEYNHFLDQNATTSDLFSEWINEIAKESDKEKVQMGLDKESLITLMNLL